MATQLRELANHWSRYFVFGIASIVLGTFALAFSTLTTLVSVVYLGALFVVASIIQAIQAFQASKWRSFFLHVIISIIYIVAGFFMIGNPTINALSLTLLLSAFFIVAGLFRIIFAFVERLPNWGWLALNGLLTLILGFLIWIQWPTSGLWVIGMFVGIDLIFSGWAWIFISLKARKIKHHLQEVGEVN
jgi:uncharacterized membrane protein HdeD (DUF308 family)